MDPAYASYAGGSSYGGGGGAPPPSEPQVFGVYIGNIHGSLTVEQLRSVFAQCGEIVNANIAGNPTNPTRFGFIDFATEEARQKALKYDGFILVDRPIKVNNSKTNIRTDRAPRQTQGAIDPTILAQMLALVQQGQLSPAALAALAGGAVAPPPAGGAPPGAPGGYPPQTAPGMPPAAPSPYGAAPPTSAPYGGYGAPPPSGYPPAPGGGYPPYGAPPTHHHHHHHQHHHAGGYGAPAPYGAPPMHHHHHHAAASFGAPYMGRGRGMTNPHFRHATVNEQPSEEVIQLRTAQRTQYLKVVEKEAERYERKLQKKQAKKAAGGGSGSDSESDQDDKRKRKE